MQKVGTTIARLAGPKPNIQPIKTMRIVRYSYPSYRTPAALGRFPQSPWSGLETEIDRLFETALSSFTDSTAASHFPVDLYEDKDNTYVRAELPGVNRDEINVEMVEDYLTISAKPPPAVARTSSRSPSAARSTFRTRSKPTRSAPPTKTASSPSPSRSAKKRSRARSASP